MSMSERHWLRFGLISEQMRDLTRWLASAQRAEELGFATFLLRDHFIADAFGPQFAPVPALMTIANRTTSLRIGSLVFDNDYRHPVLLAQETATLDLLSGGRFELGVGAGWLRDEYERAGMPFDAPGTRVSRLEEALGVVKGLFSDEPFTFTGEYYQIAGLQSFPQPAQRPHPPLLIGAGSKRMLELAGREADIVNILPRALPAGAISEDFTERLEATIEQKIALIRQAAGARFTGIELSLFATIRLTGDPTRAAERLIKERGWQGVSVDDVMAMPAVFLGPVERVVELMVERRKRYGVSYYIIADEEMEAVAPVVQRATGM
jgi:probable F420-dependent oxidoreductase